MPQERVACAKIVPPDHPRVSTDLPLTTSYPPRFFNRRRANYWSPYRYDRTTRPLGKGIALFSTID